MGNLKRMGAALLSLALISSLNLNALAAVEDTGYADVDAGSWYAQAVEYVRDNGLMSGTSDAQFSPSGTMTRAMLAQTLYRAAGSPAVSGSDAFTDTQADAWYADAVLWATQEGIISGYGGGLFGTNDPVSREQIAAILWRDAGSPEAQAGAPFADEGSIASWAGQAVDWAQSSGILSGRENNRFDPQASATRAEVAVMLRAYRTMGAPETPETPETPAEESNVLVVYYSATGNTERVANAIAQATGGDLFELTPADPYTDDDLNWTDENSRVVQEYENPEERDVELTAYTPDNWADYDVVYIGYPIWWGIAAWPVDGFVEANDFTGKTVIPFCTSSSSGLGESGQRLAQLAGTGTWLEGERFRSGASQEDVTAWVESLGLN
ncbi:flavodoxin [Pseudoflavonifractor capillosus]|uniref:flavodoxin n=1 Tax=Pseudoflavonifractor capillosus TaxID=106588 RepID=UPI00195EA669|nr:flavodoxin [Pseudoflavonifractor capillosus]MBM6682040.1 S-layer homology domain-containing protein [Pseudoflavonifractor capillosus]